MLLMNSLSYLERWLDADVITEGEKGVRMGWLWRDLFINEFWYDLATKELINDWIDDCIDS